MIYMEPSQLGWHVLFESWLDALPEYFTAPFKELITKLFDAIIPPCLKFVRKQCKEYAPTAPLMQVNALMRLFACTTEGIAEEKNSKVIEGWIRACFLFSFVWSIGASIDRDSRGKFDQFFRQLIGNELEEYPLDIKFDIPFPEEGTVYDYCFEVGHYCALFQ